SKSLPAAEIERCVVEQIRSISKDRERLHEALALAALHSDDGTEEQGRHPAPAEALALFQPEWQTLPAADPVRILRRLVAQVDYDGGCGKVAITFHPAALPALARALAGPLKE